MHRIALLITTLFYLGLSLPASVHADSASDATQRIKERLAQVDAMKAAAQIGEDAKGFLSPRMELSPRQSHVVEAENADRLILYKAVAGKTGQTPSDVGQQRALQIAERATSGVWLQKADGSWYQKP